MALTARLSEGNRNAQLAAYAARLANGYLRIYTGAQPATPEDAATGTLLAELRFQATPFATPDGGQVVSNPLVDGTALATGEAGWFRAFQSDGTTAEIDGSVGTDASYNLVIGSTSLSAGAVVTVSSFTHAIPMQQCAA